MTELNQSFLTDREHSNITVAASGTVLRPPLMIVSSIADEAKWHFTEDGISVKAIDPANVGMAAFEIPASAFNEYDVDGDTVGFVHKHLRKAMAMARHGSGSSDRVRLDTMDGQATVSVEREYGDTDVDHRQTFTTIDPESVRREPDLPTFELPNSAVVDTRAFNEVVSDIGGLSGVTFGGDGALQITEENDPEADRLSHTTMSGDVTVEEPDSTSVISTDYLEDMASALYRAYVDEVEVRWGDEFPVRLIFDRELDGETVMSGEMMIAPRIASD